VGRVRKLPNTEYGYTADVREAADIPCREDEIAWPAHAEQEHPWIYDNGDDRHRGGAPSYANGIEGVAELRTEAIRKSTVRIKYLYPTGVRK